MENVNEFIKLKKLNYKKLNRDLKVKKGKYMDNKFNNMLQEFLKDNNVKNIDEANEKFQEFIKKYNNNEIEYKNTPLDDAYELLEEAENAKTKSQSIKLAKKAYEICPECFEAILFQVDLEEDSIKRMNLLNEGLSVEKERLEKQNYFTKDNMGIFYGMFETRLYIRGLYSKATYLLLDGKIKQARDICKEILKLNKNDNTGARYLLMAIYAYLEEENELLKLSKKYPEESLETLFPLFALYYKIGDDKKAKEYLNRINKANPHFLKLFKGTIKEDKDISEGYYAKGGSSEVFVYINLYSFLIITMPNIDHYVIDNSKKQK